ncbi:hypothetical protein ASE90_03390 [Sphingomonas sp. Leaf67]|uniref:hypothetical protein n=1 Tax=Sphingomonas sp. Leaf67 TaxID=1736230 RepID=UPI0006FDD444|nr:hypothetical protein [Sphingomonas sp. Leaf67]KQN91830.1 hypothetical protein ASE90_03390 [Sphingomonas sp. Leaf67]
MAETLFRLPPLWFRVVALLMTLWGAAGVFAFYGHATTGPAQLAALPDYERGFFLALPDWFVWIYAIATWGGLLGGIALMLRRRIASLFLALSLLAVAVQFGWVFAATDLIAVKGAAAVVPFPLVIFAIALGQLAVARHADARGWLR